MVPRVRLLVQTEEFYLAISGDFTIAIDTQVWAETQALLQPQMTRATFETIIRGTRLLPVTNGTYRIQAATPMGQEWLETRLKETIVRALTHVVGHTVEIEFVAANGTPGRNCSPGVPAASIELPLPEPQLAASPCALFAREVDFQSLWFEKGRSSGYTQVPDYVLQFWMLYLNQIKPKSFDLLYRITSDDKRNINDPSFTFWTPPKKYSLRALARAVSTTSVITVSGGPRSCWFNEQAKKITGTSLSECCGKYEPAKWHLTANGTIRCQHWQIGLLEVLYQEGLVAIELVKPPPGKPRSHEMWLQVWRNLPLLTPYQVGGFSEMDQLRHAQWLERYGHYQNIDLTRWERLIDRLSLVPLLPDYGLRPESCPTCRESCSSGCTCRCHYSRRLWGEYRPGLDLLA